ncbi:potassium channel family protein [Streptomyces sp. NBC_00199]|uniref:potassium channel family protein n=1 Tax=Streptomyces sp. NBC_00199 TaxID=2975678 RepID=UPI00224E5E34|nr:potassium channel family protein [Streptomyces sp. NBC_00199]MCX5262530.1 potassium channel family protein [Streptomyces sp. NBC_00199]
MTPPVPSHGSRSAGRAARLSWSARRQAVLGGLRTVVTATGLVVGYYLLPMDSGFSGGSAVGVVVGLLGMLALFVWQIRTIARSPSPRLRAVEALSTTVPLFLLLFSGAYFLLERGTPGSFSEPLTRTDSLYFTLTVFSTVGFGDITAVTQTARVLTMVQMVGNILLVGVAAKVVASAVRTGLHRKEKGETGGTGETRETGEEAE